MHQPEETTRHMPQGVGGRPGNRKECAVTYLALSGRLEKAGCQCERDTAPSTLAEFAGKGAFSFAAGCWLGLSAQNGILATV